VGIGIAEMVSRIEIRDYCGNFEDVAQLACRAWNRDYHGNMWFPAWDAEFLRWQINEGTRLALAAYAGAKLVGTFFCVPHVLRMAAATHPIALASWCTVDPEYRSSRVAFSLIAALRRRHQELGLAFSLGVVSADETSRAHRFWRKYAETFPQDLRFLFAVRFWVKVLSPQKMARAALAGWERTAMRVGAPLIRFVPRRAAAEVRAYRPADLEGCVDIVERSSARCEWALEWPPHRLAPQLASPASGTLVFERRGKVEGLVNYHYTTMQGREALRTVIIDLWGGDGLRLAEQPRFISNLCNVLRAQGVDLVLALRSAVMPPAALLANLFIPQPAHAHMVALFPRDDVRLTSPGTWNLLLR
jgi:GNAT superfamily N-acetyltransferase